MTDMTPTFATRRKRLPVLVLTHQMRQAAFLADRDRALRCNRRDVPRIEAEARRATNEALRRAIARA